MYHIKYHYNIQFSDNIDFATLFKIKHTLRENPLKADVYLIVISDNPENQLDIYHSKYLIQRYYKENPPYVIGIAKKKEDALALVQGIMQKCFEKRRDADLKAYLLE